MKVTSRIRSKDFGLLCKHFITKSCGKSISIEKKRAKFRYILKFLIKLYIRKLLDIPNNEHDFIHVHENPLLQ